MTARESTATNSASACAVMPEGLSEDISLPSDAASDTSSSSRALNEKLSSLKGETPNSESLHCVYCVNSVVD